MPSESYAMIADEDLMLAAARGDTNAFEQIVLRHQAAVWRTACRFSGDAEEARDIAQSVFIKLFESAARYRATASFKTFLFRIVNTTCIDFSRKKRPVPQSNLPDIADETPLSSETIIALERETAVRSAMKALQPRQWSALTLRYEAELSVREIAETMQVSEKAVERLLAHAREALRSVFEKNRIAERGIQQPCSFNQR
jgi:RNA polymerase sigma-70 factor, ECF subfamily